jgi:hypothetical protein
MNKNKLKAIIWAVVLASVYVCFFLLCISTVRDIIKQREYTLTSNIYPDLIKSEDITNTNFNSKYNKANIVIAGSYLERIISFELSKSKWDYEFYQWFKWDPSVIEFESIDSLKKSTVLPVNLPFKIVNGHILDAQISNFKISPDKKSAYVLYFVRASSTQFFSSNAYPMDKHFLYIPIEHVDLNASKLKFVPDLASSKISSRVKLSGYRKGDRMVSSSLHTYQSFYGNPDENKNQSNTFNQYRFGMKIEREGFGYYSKLFIVLLVSVMIAFLSFFAEKTDKLRITVGALFTTATNNYVLTRNIPDTSTVSIAEFVDIVSLGTIFIIMCDQTLLRYLMKENKELSDYTQWITLSLTLFFYILINFTIPIISQ